MRLPERCKLPVALVLIIIVDVPIPGHNKSIGVAVVIGIGKGSAIGRAAVETMGSLAIALKVPSPWLR